MLANIRRALSILAMLVVMSVTSSAIACPNCKLANETNKDLPKAYMYSILFMIGMPATIFTGFGISFYRMVRKAQAAELAAQQSAEASAE